MTAICGDLSSTSILSSLAFRRGSDVGTTNWQSRHETVFLSLGRWCFSSVDSVQKRSGWYSDCTRSQLPIQHSWLNNKVIIAEISSNILNRHSNNRHLFTQSL